MTIKSFKEHAEINENPFAAAAAIGYGAYKAYKVAKKVAPVVKNYINRKANSYGQTAVISSPLVVPTVAKLGGTGDKATAIPDKMKSALKNPFKNRKPKTNTAYSPVKPSAKGQREEVKLDEKNPPEAHVARSKKNPDMFCVFDKDGKEVKLFKDKKDAEAYAVKNHDQLMGESLWANMHKRRKAGKAPKKPGDKGYPKTLDIEAKENYVSNAQRAAVWANRADGGKGHPDNKKKSKKETVDEISRDDMVKKLSSTIGNKVPMMLTKHDDEKKKVKTGLDRLRKALGPNHAMNQSAASEGLFFGKTGPAVVSRLARGVASRVTTKGKLDRAKKKQGKLDNKINLAKTRTDIAKKKAELKKLRSA